MMKMSGRRSAVRRSVLEKSASIWPLAITATVAGLALDGLNGYLKGKAQQAKLRRENRMHEELVRAINASAQSKQVPSAATQPAQVPGMKTDPVPAQVPAKKPDPVPAQVPAKKPAPAPVPAVTGTGSGMSRLARTGLFGGGGAGVGALIGGLTGETSSKKRRNAMIGAVLGGAAGSAVANADKIKEFVSKLMPNKAAEAWRGLTPYEQGFTSKCAELGVDPGVLVKESISFAGAKRVATMLDGPNRSRVYSTIRNALMKPVDTMISVNSPRGEYRFLRNSVLNHLQAQGGRSKIPGILAASPDKASFLSALRKHLKGLSTLEEDYQSRGAFSDALNELTAGNLLDRVIR